jgi:hypothetical protein
MNTIPPSTGTAEKFIQEPVLQGYASLPCLVVNMLSARGECRVLDFAGGTGYIYYKMKSYLTTLPHVAWHVVDSNEQGLRSEETSV